MPRYTSIMKLDPSDNRVAKFMPFDTRGEADAHVLKHIGTCPDAFVHEDADDVPVENPSKWRFDVDNRTILDRMERDKPLLLWKRLRTARDSLLVESDWTQYNDSPLTDEAKSEWINYRQSLRDLPASTEDPADPTWPEAPSE